MSTMPRWFWLLPALAAALWWPLWPYYASDDFIAVAYAQDLGAVAHDFVGPQYAATDVWSFYRPLITLSFWVDQALGGPWPPAGHVSNALAHAVSALLVAVIWRRFLPAPQAFGAGALWAMMPSHVGSIAWVVGRVDSHTTVWCLLAVWLCLRHVEGRAPRWVATAATAGALLSKELALVLPALCWWLALLRADGSLRSRVGVASRATAPAWLLLGGYLVVRLVALGGFGGYEASAFEPTAAARGVGSILLDLLVPLRWSGTPGGGDGADELFFWAALAPVMVAAFAAFAARPKLTAGALAAYALALAPMASFLAACPNPHNLRDQYQPAVFLAGALAAGGRWIAPALAIAWLWPLVAVRADQVGADRASRSLHAEMLRTAPEAPAGPMFVGGLPHANGSGTAVQLHFGVDRMLRPPFHEPGVPLYAWRPLLQRPEAARLDSPTGAPFALPAGSTWWFPEPYAMVRADAPPPLPDLPMTGDEDGVVDLTTPVLDAMLATFAAGADGPTLKMPGVRAAGFRVTIFTANGYLCCWCPDHAGPGADGAELSFAKFFGGDAQHPAWKQPAMVTRTLDADIGGALVVPTTIDLEPTFPALVEAGEFDLERGRFRPTHRAQRLLQLRFDRGYPGWVRRCQGR
ncbi:MAG: hypothetical protein ACON4Z_10340 [Planctomycetota bacterium]